MKILEVTRSYYPSIGGLEKFISDRIKIYRDLGYDYKIFTSSYSTEKSANELNGKSVLKFKQYTKYNYIPNLKKRLPVDCDLVMINQIGNYLSDYSINFYSHINKPIVLTPHLYFHTQKYKLFKFLHKKFVRDKLLKSISKLICFTEYEKQYWLSKSIIDPGNILVIPHYYDIINSLEDMSVSDPFLLYLGRTSPNKKIELLLEAYTELTEFPYSLYLTIERTSINKRLLKKVELNNKIQFIGHISDSEKKKYLSCCSALILPSTYEAFSIVTVEASAYKKPLLLSNLPIFHETLNTSGVLFFELNKESIKECLIRFARLSTHELTILGAENYQNLSKYQYLDIKEKYQMLFNNLQNT